MGYAKLILIISVLLSSALIVGIKHPLQGDEFQFLLLGSNLKEGRGFSLSEKSPYLPSMEREPVYPAMLSLLFRIFGYKYLAIKLVQVLVFMLICIFVWLLSREVFNAQIAGYATVATAFCPTLISYPAFLYSEILASLLILLSVFGLTMVIKKQSLFWCGITGFVLGLSVLCKAIMLPFSILALLILLYINVRIRKKEILPMILFIICFGLTVSPWILRNYRLFHKPAVSLRGAKVLWVRAQKIDYSSDEIARHLIFSFSESLGAKLYPAAFGSRTSDIYLSDSLRSDAYLLELEKKGVTPIEIDDIFFREALKKIMRHPLKFILLTPLEFIKMASFIYLPSLNQPYILDKINKSNIFLKISVLLFRGIMRLSAYLIFIMALFGMYLARRMWLEWIFLFLIILYINLAHSLLFGDGRYATPIIPFYIIFAAITLERLKKCPLGKD